MPQRLLNGGHTFSAETFKGLCRTELVRIPDVFSIYVGFNSFQLSASAKNDDLVKTSAIRHTTVLPQQDGAVRRRIKTVTAPAFRLRAFLKRAREGVLDYLIPRIRLCV